MTQLFSQGFNNGIELSFNFNISLNTIGAWEILQKKQQQQMEIGRLFTCLWKNTRWKSHVVELLLSIFEFIGNK